MTTKVCNHCGKEKDEEKFNWWSKSLGIRNPACRDCQHAFNKDYLKVMPKIVTYSRYWYRFTVFPSVHLAEALQYRPKLMMV
jgi:hypothetical protein